MTIPWIAEAVVVSQDPDNYGVFVSLTSGFGGQGPAMSVRVGTHGPRDGVTGHFPALPTIGTPGLVAFPRGDIRNGVWMCSTSTQLTDASAHAPGSGAIDYAAHYGGGWSYRSEDGQVTEAFPDGTVLQVGPATPAPTRHTIDGNTQARQRTPFTAAQRRPQAPAAFPVSISHPTGAAAVLSASGAWAITAAPGQSITLSVSGGATFTLSGNTLTVGSDTTVSIASTTSIALTAPQITASNGGTVKQVKLSDNSNSTVLLAQ